MAIVEVRRCTNPECNHKFRGVEGTCVALKFAATNRYHCIKCGNKFQITYRHMPFGEPEREPELSQVVCPQCNEAGGVERRYVKLDKCPKCGSPTKCVDFIMAD